MNKNAMGNEQIQHFLLERASSVTEMRLKNLLTPSFLRNFWLVFFSRLSDSLILQPWTKVLGQIYICRAFFKSHMPNNNVGRVYAEFFPSFNKGKGKGEPQDIFEKVALFYEGTHKLQKITNTATLSQGLLSRIVNELPCSQTRA